LNVLVVQNNDSIRLNPLELASNESRVPPVLLRKPLARSNEIHRILQRKYRFGDLGVFESIASASTQVEGLKMALSTAIVSPPGEAKTRILRDVLSMFPESDYVLVDGAITEYHIAKEEKYQDLRPQAVRKERVCSILWILLIS